MRLEGTGDRARVNTRRSLTTHYLILVAENLLVYGRGDRNQLSRPISFVDLRRCCQLVDEPFILEVARTVSLRLELRLQILRRLILLILTLSIKLLQLNLEIGPTFDKRSSLVFDSDRVL